MKYRSILRISPLNNTSASSDVVIISNHVISIAAILTCRGARRLAAPMRAERLQSPEGKLRQKPACLTRPFLLRCPFAVMQLREVF